MLKSNLNRDQRKKSSDDQFLKQIWFISLPKLHTRIHPPKKSCTAKTSMMIHKASQEPRKKPLAIAYKLSAAVSILCKSNEIPFVQASISRASNPSIWFFFLYRVKNCAIEIACIDSPHIVIYTTHASSTALIHGGMPAQAVMVPPP